MKKIPDKIHNPYLSFLKQHEIPSRDITFYLKWLRYYLDFCQKYSYITSAPNSLTHFILKLKQKNQTEQQIEQAKQAIVLFYKLIESYNGDSPKSSTQRKDSTKKSVNDSPTLTNISKNQSWKNEFEILTNEIKLRKYSRKTLKAYTYWVGSFQAYLKSKSPKLFDSIDAKNFITYLAVEKKVSALTQNQAFNALLFFYRHVLKREFGDLKDIPQSLDELDTLVGWKFFQFRIHHNTSQLFSTVV